MHPDNSQKIALRTNAIRHCPGPVLETHGTAIGEQCYGDRIGVVLAKDEQKVEQLARARPTWAVYQCDSTRALEAGLAAHVAFAVLDVDCTSAWPVLEAFFKSERAFATTMIVTSQTKKSAHDRFETLVLGRYRVTAWAEYRAGNTTHYAARLVLIESTPSSTHHREPVK